MKKEQTTIEEILKNMIVDIISGVENGTHGWDVEDMYITKVQRQAQAEKEQYLDEFVEELETELERSIHFREYHIYFLHCIAKAFEQFKKESVNE